MRVPYRKPGKFSQMKLDPFLTKEKFIELENKLRKLKDMHHPRAVAEVMRLSQTGDFSENAAYQLAKGRLRGINQRILELENQLKQAVIIEKSYSDDKVQLGSIVTVESDGKKKTFQILGSAETSPQTGIISHISPIGSALMGRSTGDTVTIKLVDKEVGYTILKIQ